MNLAFGPHLPMHFNDKLDKGTKGLSFIYIFFSMYDISVRRKNKFTNWPIALQLMPVKVIIRCVCGLCLLFQCFDTGKCSSIARYRTMNVMNISNDWLKIAAHLTFIPSTLQRCYCHRHRHISLGRYIFFCVSESRHVFWKGGTFDSGTATQALENHRKKRINKRTTEKKREWVRQKTYQ